MILGLVGSYEIEHKKHEENFIMNQTRSFDC
jgi:hypothetical protein